MPGTSSPDRRKEGSAAGGAEEECASACEPRACIGLLRGLARREALARMSSSCAMCSALGAAPLVGVGAVGVYNSATILGNGASGVDSRNFSRRLSTKRPCACDRASASSARSRPSRSRSRREPVGERGSVGERVSRAPVNASRSLIAVISASPTAAASSSLSRAPAPPNTHTDDPFCLSFSSLVRRELACAIASSRSAMTAAKSRWCRSYRACSVCSSSRCRSSPAR
mmetsp:Transcript_1025/g.1911  ORF Transcript_1025/g.1911 Transcript_1025/m.1911 type:complete len:228 (-) Transcript_1025:508-1191(-)